MEQLELMPESGFRFSPLGSPRSNKNQVSARSNSTLRSSIDGESGRGRLHTRKWIVRKFNKIPLLYRVLLIIAVPVIFLVAVSSTLMQTVSRGRQEKALISGLHSQFANISAVIHALQLERGWSSTFNSPGCPVASNCSAAALTSLSTMRARTDTAWAEFQECRARNKALDDRMQAVIPVYRQALAQVTDMLGDWRAQVENHLATSYAIALYFERLIAVFIHSIMKTTSFSSNSGFTSAVNAYVTIMTAKERAGMSRASGAAFWGSGVPDIGAQERYQGLLSDTASLVDMYIHQILDQAPVKLLAELKARPYVISAVANYLAIARNETRAMAGIPTSVFMVNATLYVNALGEVESLQARAIAESARTSVRESDIVLVAFAFVATVLTCTVLTALLIASVRASNRALAKALATEQHKDRAIRKFVPTKFMHLLDVTDATKLTVGMRSELQLTVMFADLRGFTRTAEILDPDTCFDILLAYTNIVNPVISKRGGFIDKWLGDGVLCVFIDAEEALFASIELQAEVKRLNIQRQARLATAPTLTTVQSLLSTRFGEPPASPDVIQKGCDADIPGMVCSSRESASTRARDRRSALAEFQYALGIGIHTGFAIAGVVGDAARVDGTIIGDAVNVASRLEAIAGKLGAEIIISETVHAKLGNPRNIRMRSLGPTTLAGRAEPITIYEVYETNTPELRRIKQTTAMDLERALLLKVNGDSAGSDAVLSCMERGLPVLSDPVVKSFQSMARRNSSLSEKE